MSTATMAYARSSGRPRRLVLDPWLTGSVLALLLLGLVMVASASIGISEREIGEPFYYFQRQAAFVVLGLVAAVVGVTVPTQFWEKQSIWLLAGAFVLLILVLTPGLGHEVNGSRRWIRLGVMNFQVSELARVMILTWIASFAVRRADELRHDFKGFVKPVGVLCAAVVLLLAEPDFGAATSTVILSVSSSTRTSSFSTGSPACFDQRPTVASTTDSPSGGTRISTDICRFAPNLNYEL